MADAIEIFTSSASERIEVVTSGAQGPKGDAGGATFDQDLNTTDGVTFASVAVGTDLRINGASNEIYFPADGSGGVISFEEQIIRSGSNYVLSWSEEATYHYVPLQFSSPATAATTRTNLGLGTAATSNVGDFAQINGSPTFGRVDFNGGGSIYETGAGLVIKPPDTAPGFNSPIYLTSTSGCILNADAPIGWQTSTFQLFNTGSLLQFVGKTSSFPALKRVSSALQVRLADDSAFANFYAAMGLFTEIIADSGGFQSVTASSGVYVPNNGKVAVGSTGIIGFAPTGDATGVLDTILYRDDAAVFAQRNGPNPQEFRVYNTYNTSANYERGFMRWSGNVLKIGTEKGGTGTARALEFLTDGVVRGGFDTSGNFSANILLGSNKAITFGNGFTMLDAPATAGVLRIYPFSGSSVRIQLGGNTASYPAIYNSGTTIQAVLANNTSTFTAIQGKLTTDTNAAAGTITPDKTLTLYDAAGTAYKVPCVAA